MNELVKALGRMVSASARFRSSAKSRTRRSNVSATGIRVDATYLKARQDGRVDSVTVVVAVVAMAETGERESPSQVPARTERSEPPSFVSWSLVKTQI